MGYSAPGTFFLLLAKNKLLSFILCDKGHRKGKPWRKRRESKLWEIHRISSNGVASISKYTWSLRETRISGSWTWETSGTAQPGVMGGRGLTGVPSVGDAWTLGVSLAREETNISVILPLIRYETLSEIECLDAVSLLTDFSMDSFVHNYCNANKCASNAFPLLLFPQNLCQTIQLIVFQCLQTGWESINCSSYNIHTKAKEREE